MLLFVLPICACAFQALQPMRLSGVAQKMKSDIAFELPQMQKEEDAFQKNLPPKPTMPTAEEQEAELVCGIEGSPTVAVSGIFDDESRTDQFLLDCLHDQGAWGRIVAYAPDADRTKKVMMSRSARYSGLLDVLAVESLPEDRSPKNVAKCLAQTSGAKAWIAFGVAKSEVRAYLEAARSANFERIVVATEAARKAPTLLSGGGKMAGWQQQSKVGPSEKEFPELKWTVLDFEVTAFEDDVREGGPVAVNRVDQVASEEEPLKTIARNDAYRLAAEAFVVRPAAQKRLVVENGGLQSRAFLKELREEGFSRRGEVAKMINGSLETYKVYQAEVREAKDKWDTLKENPRNLQDELNMEKFLLYQRSKEQWQARRERQIAQKVRDVLTQDFKKKKWNEARAYTKEQWIEANWQDTAVAVAKDLGFYNDMATGNLTSAYAKPQYFSSVDGDPYDDRDFA